MSDAEQAIKLAPKEPVNLFTRGFVYRKKGDLDKAMADFDAAVRLDKDSARRIASVAKFGAPRATSIRR